MLRTWCLQCKDVAGSQLIVLSIYTTVTSFYRLLFVSLVPRTRHVYCHNRIQLSVRWTTFRPEDGEYNCATVLCTTSAISWTVARRTLLGPADSCLFNSLKSCNTYSSFASEPSILDEVLAHWKSGKHWVMPSSTRFQRLVEDSRLHPCAQYLTYHRLSPSFLPIHGRLLWSANMYHPRMVRLHRFPSHVHLPTEASHGYVVLGQVTETHWYWFRYSSDTQLRWSLANKFTSGCYFPNKTSMVIVVGLRWSAFEDQSDSHTLTATSAWLDSR